MDGEGEDTASSTELLLPDESCPWAAEGSECRQAWQARAEDGLTRVQTLHTTVLMPADKSSTCGAGADGTADGTVAEGGEEEEETETFSLELQTADANQQKTRKDMRMCKE